MDIAGAQAAFDRLGRVSRIDRVCAPVSMSTHSATACANNYRPGSSSIDRKRRWRRPPLVAPPIASISNVLALVALFTVAAGIFDTGVQCGPARAQFALLRVLGVTRRNWFG